MNVATALISDLQANGINLSVAGEKLKIDAPKGKLSPEFTEQLRLHKAQIISQLSAPKAINLQVKMNELIARGIFFHPMAAKFRIENAHLATATDFEFLRTYSTGILCILQQGLLAKWIFNDAPTFLGDFRHEVAERELLMTLEEGKEIPNEIHERAVIEVTKSWFADIFKERL